jgi:hypothetical protein
VLLDNSGAAIHTGTLPTELPVRQFSRDMEIRIFRSAP